MKVERMEAKLCWYCEKNEAVAERNYPTPYTTAKFFEGTGEGGVRTHEFNIPRCVECAREHISRKFPPDISFKPTAVFVFLASIVILTVFFDFLEGVSLILLAGLPALMMWAGALLFHKRRSKKVASEIRPLKDVMQYPPIAEAQGKMNLVSVDDPLTDAQKNALTSPGSGIQQPRPEGKRGWAARLQTSLSMLVTGFALAGMGGLGLELSGAIGEGGAVMVSGGGSVVFLPLVGAVWKYIFLFSFGLMAAAGYALILGSVFAVLASLVMEIINSLHGKQKSWCRRAAQNNHPRKPEVAL